MKIFPALRCLSFLLFAFPVLPLGAGEPLQAFPEAREGEVRHVIKLPEMPDESLLRVELIVGREVETDPHNRYFFAGRLEEGTVEGWGYGFYRLDKLGPMAGTLMAVDPEAPKMTRFITLGGEPELVRYNSRLPLVVYLPEDAGLRYRVWAAGEIQLPQPPSPAPPSCCSGAGTVK